MATKLTPKKPPARAADSVLYLYGVSQGPAGGSLTNRGVDGLSAVQAIACNGLACWVSRVNRSDYADRLAENMENLDWLATAGLRHQQVVSELGRSGTILPARFGTVFLSEQSLRADVERRRPALLKAFRRLAEADEWGVKVFAIAQTLSPVTAASGKDYLRQKAARIKAKGGAPDADVRSFTAKLQKLAAAVAPGGKVSSGQPGLEWHGSLLLQRKRYPQLQRLVDQYSRRWQGRHRIECTGPWPPYSFVDHG